MNDIFYTLVRLTQGMEKSHSLVKAPHPRAQALLANQHHRIVLATTKLPREQLNSIVLIHHPVLVHLEEESQMRSLMQSRVVMVTL